ncbi:MULTISPECIES: ABC transporter ATP-binding protein [unclassified Nocardioides]|uniref:ABC transporter ATP-binding protein n=1 Tax=Nocardioides sp. URHA0032 TaxID=1380388 RepID=UPI00048BF918|nr:ABC transporter ATP-binding protein [Nocardioides sp. URHA0032]
MTGAREGEPVVSAQGLTKTYGALSAVDHVDLEVGAGDVYGLLGPNGAGKTTFMRMLFGLIRPDSGEISVSGVPVQPEPRRALAEVAGFVEAPRFYPYLSGRKNLELLGRLDGGLRPQRINEVLEVVDLFDRRDSRVREYSYGMVQRLGVAAALMRDPRLLVLDEPTNGLDPAGIRDMRNLIHRLVDTGLTILLSSHHMVEVDEICTRVAIMRRGRLAYDGPITELRAQAGRATRHLDTTDNHVAVEVCRGFAGVEHVQLDGPQIVFDADEATVERLSRELVHAGLGIHRLHAPTSALETLFFRLTEGGTGTPTDEEAAA